nr:HEPN domain-containing protein [uncultured Methanoregula sp.]
MDKFKEKFFCDGTWWKPEFPDDRINGTLSYNYREGIKLDLNSEFNSEKNCSPFSCSDIINGISEKGIQITLYGCAFSGGPSGTRRLNSSEYYSYQKSGYFCTAAYISHHFLTVDEIKFKKISFSLNNLTEWLGISGFHVDHEVDHEKDDIKFIVEYSRPKSIIVKLNDQFTMSIDFRRSGPSYNPLSEVKIVQTPRITIESNSEEKLSNFLKIITQIRYFLSLGIMTPVYPYNFSGEIVSEKLEAYDRWIGIYMQLDKKMEVEKEIHFIFMLFTYKDIQNKFSDLLKTWFEKQKQLEPVIDLYFSIFFNPEMSINNQFLGAVQAIESYHRRFKKNELLEKTEFRKMTQSILHALPEDQQTWLKPKLAFANEPSLYYRLKELFSEYCELGFIFNFHREHFAREVTDTRNYLTHYSSNLEKKALSGTDIVKATQQLKAIIQYLILLELGFTRDEAQKFANKISSRQFSQNFITFNL